MMKWGEWCRLYNKVWGYYWPSDDSLKGGSRASREWWTASNWNSEKQNHSWSGRRGRGDTTVFPLGFSSPAMAMLSLNLPFQVFLEFIFSENFRKLLCLLAAFQHFAKVESLLMKNTFFSENKFNDLLTDCSLGWFSFLSYWHPRTFTSITGWGSERIKKYWLPPQLLFLVHYLKTFFFFYQIWKMIPHGGAGDDTRRITYFQ